MPIGCYSLVPHVAYHLVTRRARRVLDLGIGFGIYGGVVRQWLDLGVRPWSTYLVGVEGWANYRSPMWDLYDLIIADSIERYASLRIEQFDCILIMDVIEHFTKEDGFRLLSSVRELVAPNGSMLIGTPAIFAEQGAVYGNEFERHRSVWSPADFESAGFRVLCDGSPDQFGNQMVLSEWTHRQEIEQEATEGTEKYVAVPIQDLNGDRVIPSPA
jgi:predicted SAM-dependent methyltransferase